MLTKWGGGVVVCRKRTNILRGANMKKVFSMFLFLILFISGCTTVEPQLSKMQIREITTKEIQGGSAVVFKSTMAVLQDQDYIIENTDFNAGLIVAEKEINVQAGFSDFLLSLADAKHKRTGKIKVSVTIGEVNENVSKVRINIQEKELTSGTYNTVEDIKNIQAKEIYDRLFHEISVEVARRK